VKVINHRFEYHAPPHYGVVEAHSKTRAACLAAAMIVEELVPEGRERAPASRATTTRSQ
jgi:hypothetical protein